MTRQHSNRNEGPIDKLNMSSASLKVSFPDLEPKRDPIGGPTEELFGNYNFLLDVSGDSIITAANRTTGR